MQLLESIQVEKFAILLVTIVGIISVAEVLASQSASSQQNTTTPINFTKIFLENRDLCLTESTAPCRGSTVDVLYEDQSTVALESGYIDSIWKAVAEVKKYGYKIDGMTSYPFTESTGDQIIGNRVNILVVMSK